jgi:AraC-like DNA-binding protein
MSLPSMKLTKIEQETLAEIRSIRASAENVPFALLLDHPALLVHHFIVSTHGNVQLRMALLARELGIGMRTLERAFAREYHQTMTQCQVDVRLSYSKWMLSIFPPTKISAVASILGYEQVQDFNRFFKKHTKQSPSAWSRQQQERNLGEFNDSGASP